jgi:hypothetical protein
MVREFGTEFRRVFDAAIAAGRVRHDLDADRAIASLCGSLLFARLFADTVIDEQFLDGVIDDFVATNAPR